MFVGNIKIQFMKSFKLLIAVALITSFTSCSVQKRLYRKGYSVHWNSMDKSIKSDVVENKIESSDEEVKVENSDFASVSPEIVIKERPVVQLNDEKLIENKNLISIIF